MAIDAFLLNSTIEDRDGQTLLTLYGATERGGIVIEYFPHNPLFFIESGTSLPRSVVVEERRSLELKTFQGKPVDGLYFRSFRNYRSAQKIFNDTGVTTYESDVKAGDRFLMERFIRGSFHITASSPEESYGNKFLNPIITPTKETPVFALLSVDIETGRDGTVYSIALCQTGRDGEKATVLMRGEGLPSYETVFLPSESALLTAFLEIVKDWDPDIIIGWHVIGFDLRFIERRCSDLHIPFLLGRSGRPPMFFKSRRGGEMVDIDGRIVLDGPRILRSNHFKFEDFRLETVSRTLLGRGKTITSEENKVNEIEYLFRNDKEKLAEYNVNDARLVIEIFDRTKILDQIVERSRITGLPLDRIDGSVAAFDNYMLPRIHRKGYVAPEVKDIKATRKGTGGYVFTSEPGLYGSIAVLDFKSLYPTVIRTFHIDPYSRLKAQEDPLYTPAGIPFSRKEHLLAEGIAKMMEEREEAKQTGNSTLSQAIKILMNSFYGVMGTPGSRFHHPDLSQAITESGRWILKAAIGFFEENGRRIIYGDTDSLFVLLEPGEGEDEGKTLARSATDYFTELLWKEFNAESFLELEFEKIYKPFFLPPMRGKEAASCKKYVGKLADGTIEFKGMETVRSDWSPLAKVFETELYSRFFEKKEMKEWIREWVKRLRSGEVDHLLVYKRRLRRSEEKYVKTTPPHIKAVRMLREKTRRVVREISYVITPEGPVPIDLEPDTIDYRHYIDKQLKPIADTVLRFKGESFDLLVNGREQTLF